MIVHDLFFELKDLKQVSLAKRYRDNALTISISETPPAKRPSRNASGFFSNARCTPDIDSVLNLLTVFGRVSITLSAVAVIASLNVEA